MYDGVTVWNIYCVYAMSVGVVFIFFTPRLQYVHCNLIFFFTSLEITSFSHLLTHFLLSLSVLLVRIQVNFFCRHINHVGTGVCRMNSLRPGRVERMLTEIHLTLTAWWWHSWRHSLNGSLAGWLKQNIHWYLELKNVVITQCYNF